MAKYSQEVADRVYTLIPDKVRKSINEFGWNEFGIYEAVKKAIKEIKKKGGKIIIHK